MKIDRLPTFIVISFAIHLTAAAIFFLPPWDLLSLSAGAKGGVSPVVEVVRMEVEEGGERKIVNLPKASIESTGGEKSSRDEGVSEVAGIGVGSSRSPNSPHSVLSEIRARIQRSKRYPLLARRHEITGSAEITFRLDKEGEVTFARLTKSSGHGLLDNAALETIRNAAPYPYYEGLISIALDFKTE